MPCQSGQLLLYNLPVTKHNEYEHQKSSFTSELMKLFSYRIFSPGGHLWQPSIHWKERLQNGTLTKQDKFLSAETEAINSVVWCWQVKDINNDVSIPKQVINLSLIKCV